MMITLFVIHLACSCALVGLIWTMQVVHYPLLKQVGPEEFVAYHARHMALITWLVGPLMLAELGSAAWLLFLGGTFVVLCRQPRCFGLGLGLHGDFSNTYPPKTGVGIRWRRD